MFNVPCNFDASALSLRIRSNYSRTVAHNELQDGNKWGIRLVVRRDSSPPKVRCHKGLLGDEPEVICVTV